MCSAPPQRGLRWLLAVCCLSSCLAAPVRTKGTFVDDKVQHYLMKFGYLPQSDLETGSLRTEQSLRDAIRELQRFGGLPATGLVDPATVRLLAAPRCGVADRQEPVHTRYRRYALQGLKWDYTNLTWSLRTKNPLNLDSGRVRGVLAKALDVWAQHSKLTFQELDSEEADILVRFERRYHGDGYPFDGKGQILAHAFFPNSGRGGDAHFDEEEVWLTDDYDDNEEGTSLFLVAAHEFGHSLGLSHSSVEGALMYPWYQGLKPNFQLPDDDRHGIQQMYGAKEKKIWDIKPVYVHPPTSPPRTTERPTRRHPHSRYYPEKYPEKPYYPDKHPKHPYYPPKEPHKPHHVPHYPEKHPERHPERYPDKPWERDPSKRYPELPRRLPTERVPENDPRRYPGYDRPRYPVTERPRYPETTTRRPRVDAKPAKPDTCDTSYDAISVIRREVFIFKDAYLWRIGDTGLNPNYPAEITRMWHGLPANLTHIDAIYERPDNKIVFFIGKQYYIHNGNDVLSGYPKPLSNLGLPESLEKLDAAMVWGHNSKTYFYSGTMYWRFDEDLGKVELDYPRDMSMWKGVGYNIDTVFQWKDGKTYFFKGKGFWKFNDLKMSVEKEDQTLSAPFWMGCPRTIEGPQSRTKEKFIGAPASSSSVHFSSIFINILSLILLSRLWTLGT